MKKKIIVPTGYMGSGSSAVTMLLSEFENTNNPYGSFEYVLFHCPDGLFDLEDKLIRGNNALRSDEAIHSFEKRMNELYDKKYWWVGHYNKIIGEDFKKAYESFVASLIDYESDLYWYMQENTDTKVFFKLIFNRIVKLCTLGKIKLKKPLIYEPMRLCYSTQEEFYEKSRVYIDNLENIFTNNNTVNVVMDQLLLPHNLFRIDNYFGDELRAIVVERDPRDVFLSNKYIWSKKGVPVPFPTDVYSFCECYDKMRKIEKVENSNKVLRVHFEDLIYNYDKSIKEIIEFLGFTAKNHIRKKSSFKPEISKMNTQLFRDEAYKKEVDIIEKRLGKYLYNFPYELKNDLKKIIEPEDSISQ